MRSYDRATFIVTNMASVARKINRRISIQEPPYLSVKHSKQSKSGSLRCQTFNLQRGKWVSGRPTGNCSARQSSGAGPGKPQLASALGKRVWKSSRPTHSGVMVIRTIEEIMERS